MKILAIDPGINNYAFSVVTHKPDVIFAGHLNNPIKSIKPIDSEANILLYKQEILTLIDFIELETQDIIAMERYQTRGHKNVQIELVNVMLGVVAALFPSQLKLYTPATWKNYIKRLKGTNDMYKLLGRKDITPHIADSIGIAAYTLSKCYKVNLLDALMKGDWTWKTKS